jgi:hypothetical protein
VGYQEAFIPFGTVPFQKVLNITLAFQLPHGTSLNLATVAAPNGGTKWSAYAGTYVQAPWLPAASSGRGTGRARIAGYVVTGRVVDAYGVEVTGAAIVVNGATTYTGTDGKFVARIKKNETVNVVIDLEDFTAPGTWEVVSAPASAVPGTEIEITVRRKS